MCYSKFQVSSFFWDLKLQGEFAVLRLKIVPHFNLRGEYELYNATFILMEAFSERTLLLFRLSVDLLKRWSAASSIEHHITHNRRAALLTIFVEALYSFLSFR